jgi:hypothetical protein
MRDYLHCTWKEYTNGGLQACKNPATICVVYGCLEGHLNEFVGCGQHYSLWTAMVDNNQEPCHLRACNGSIDSWRQVKTEKLTAGFKTYMMTRQ